MFEKYKPKEMEVKVLEKWERNNSYGKVKDMLKGRKKYFFMDGPPYASGYIHMGTTLNKILKDSYIRFYRLKGYDVWDQPGYDTHGTPIEVKVEKELGFKNKKDIEKYGVKKFIDKCKDFATRHIDAMNNDFKNLGVWMDWENPYLTLDNSYMEGAWYTFKKAFEKGLLYEGRYPVHVCTRCGTALAFNEIEYMKKTDPSVYVKFKVEGKEEYLVIWTTTPWTLPSNVAIMVHPDFDYVKVKVNGEVLIIAKELVEEVMGKLKAGKYEILEEFKGKDLKGVRYLHPFKDKVPALQNIKEGHYVVTSNMYVTLDSGTGLVHVAPGHGQEDYNVGKEYGLDIVCPLGMDGLYKEEAGEWLKGKYATKANSLIIDVLEERNALLHKEDVTHDYPKCWRCDTPLLLMSVPQWFFKVSDIQEDLIKENEDVVWHPGWAKNRFKNWLNSIGDWPISRQRYWDIPLPIWKCECGNVDVIGSIKELKEKGNVKEIKDLHKPEIDEVKIKCSKCGKEMLRVKDVLDVWFDSGVASWASLGYPSKKEEFERLWPSDLQIEGPDQFRGWWNSQLITSYITFGKKPFKEIILHGFVLDNKGIKMSKSKGNVVGPEEVIEKHGRDVLRMYLLSNAPWDNFYFNWQDVKEMHNVLNILWNVYQFTKTYTSVRDLSFDYNDLNVEDKWLLSKFERIKMMSKEIEEKRMHKFVQSVREFVVMDLSRWFIKLVRDRLSVGYEGKDRESTEKVLRKVVHELSIILTPVVPFISNEIYEGLGIGEKEVPQMEEWPEFNEEYINIDIEEKMEIVKEITEVSNNLRQEAKIKLRWPVKEVKVKLNPEFLKLDFKDMEGMVKRITNSKEFKVVDEKEEGKEYLGKEFSKGVVYINVSEDEELKEERALREIVRQIQMMRKENGKKVGDVVSMNVGFKDQRTKKYLEKYKQEIEKETTSKINVVDNNEGKEIKVFDYELWVGF